MKQYPEHLKRIRDLNTNLNVQKIFVIGCGKSGTYYMKSVFNILGFNIGHEYMDTNGISSWYEVSDKRSADIKKWFKGHKCLYVHIVRNPIDYITSSYRPEVMNGRHGLEYFKIHCPEYNDLPVIDLIAKSWIVWNRKTQKNFNIDWTMKVENIQKEENIQLLCDELDVKFKPNYMKQIINLGKRVHSKKGSELKAMNKQGIPELKREDVLPNLSGTIYNELIQEAKLYGYNLNG